MILNTLYSTTIISMGGLSGGLIYFMLNDLDKIYIKRTQISGTKFNNIHQIFNIGFFIGTGLGICYAYTGRSLIENINLCFYKILKGQIQSSITGAK